MSCGAAFLDQSIVDESQNVLALLTFASDHLISLLHSYMIGETGDSVGTWRERLAAWKEMLEREKLSEQINSSSAKYVVEFDMKEVEKSLRKDVIERTSETEGTRALWISKRWWRYRPKLPYTYFLQKLDSSEVQL